LSVTEQDSSIGSRANDPLIGRQLGDYRLTSKLASGGMASVYKGMDYKLQRSAAVKVLDRSKVDDDRTLHKRFQREAQSVAALDHNNIIRIYQFGEEEDLYFLAMHLVKGKDLSAELKRLRRRGKNTTMSVTRALDIMTQVASALDYAHSKDFIHRDVKPSNILLERDTDRAILMDFGLVFRASAETTMGTAFGTPRYIAPEQAISSNKVVPQSDIYAFAVIMYELLTGQTPFDGESPMEIALSHISDPPPPPRSIKPEIPEAVERELLKALDKEPENRHKTTMDFVNAIRRGYDKASEKASATTQASTTAPSTTKPSQSSALVEDATLIDVGVPVPAAKSGAKPAAKVSTPAASAQKKAGISPVFIGLIAVALLIAAFFIMNQLGGGSFAGGDGAPVALIYDENTFTFINEGDYTLQTEKLMFVRGVNDGPDDYSGGRIRQDILPPGMCYQIVLQGRNATVPPQCAPIANHRHAQETLVEPLRFHWRSESQNSGTINTFAVLYDGKEVTRCDTVPRGGAGECRFNWPVPPPPTPTAES
jgi:serine/threonine protein kinase